MVGLPVGTRDLRLEAGSSDLVVAVTGDGVVSGARVKAGVDYDAQGQTTKLLAAKGGTREGIKGCQDAFERIRQARPAVGEPSAR